MLGNVQDAIYKQLGAYRSDALAYLIYGQNTDVDSAAEEDLSATCTGATTDYAPPTAARVHTLVSGSAADDGSPQGTGAGVVLVDYLDSNFARQTANVTLNGVGGVAMAEAAWRINTMYCTTVGSGKVNAGAITATAATDATVTSIIPASSGRSFVAHFTVPAGYIGYLTRWAYSVSHPAAATASVIGMIKIRPYTESIQILSKHGLYASGSSSKEITFRRPLEIPAKSDVWIRLNAAADNAVVLGEFEIFCVPA